ncbi:hypothetical protein OS493_003970 [Desmophyllum pertusum]|uniref:Uncharacterized protein n=1 Tax=Desmophyllum pertusum TaxID=174260 RepID=A0A9W9ZSD3_9CNID|nr:hypothetical protein OS493_003970 [Desmophyllum pertusum]
MMLYLLITAILCSSAAAGPAAKSSCSELYASYDLSRNFNETIAHTIHSMTVQGLRLFNPRATAENLVPTVNHNIQDKGHLVLPFAPEDPRGKDFTTETMNIIDAILSRIGNDDDGLGPNWSSTERIVHRFHMIDMWHRVQEVYQEVAENPPQDDLCDCLLDTSSNGIYQAVHRVAERYKSDTPTPTPLLNRPMPKLKDADSWKVWKESSLYHYRRPSLYDSSLFLYCATKDF